MSIASVLRHLPVLALPPRRLRTAADAPGRHRAALRPALADARPQGTPRVTAIILHRNGPHLLEALLSSLCAQETWPALDLVLVDHGSQDDSLTVARAWAERLPAGWRLDIVARRGNHSFSYSNNRAAERARGEFLLLLNNDIVFQQPVIGRMVAACQATGGLIGLGQRENQPPGPDGERPWHHLGVRYFWNASMRFIVPRNAAPRPGDEALCAAPVAVPAATASIMLCARGDYLAVGGLHEGYVYGYEDIDLCALFALRLGRPVIVLNDVTALHGDGATRKTAGTSKARKARNRANKDRLVARWGLPLWRWLGPLWLRDDGSARGLSPGLAVIGAAEGAGPWLDSLRAAGWFVTSCAGGGLRGLDGRGIDVALITVPGWGWRRFRRRDVLLLRVAWTIGREAAWCACPALPEYDLVVAASPEAADRLRAAGAPRVCLADALSGPEPLARAREEGLRIAVRGAPSLIADLGRLGVTAWPVRDAWSLDEADVIACQSGVGLVHDARPVVMADGDARGVVAQARAALDAGARPPMDHVLPDLPGEPWPQE